MILLLFLFVLSYLLNAQKTIMFDNEVGVYVGISVPTMNSRGFYDSPENIVFKVSVSKFKSLSTGFTTGLQYLKKEDFDRVTIPFYFSYRSTPSRIPIPPLYGLLIPFNIVLSAGPNFGYLKGDVDKESTLKLNRNFVTSMDISARFSFILGQISLMLCPEFSYLLTKNYAYGSDEGWKKPGLFFNGSVGIGYMF